MIRISLLLSIGLLFANSANAVCRFNSGARSIFTIPPATIQISADTAVDGSKPIAEFESSQLGHDIIYSHCDIGSEYGKRVIDLLDYDTSERTFKTNIPGIVIKPLWQNGDGRWGRFPSTSYIPPHGDSPTVIYYHPSISKFKIQFFKISDNVQLSDPDGDVLITPGDIAYTYLMNSDPSAFLTKLAVSEIRLVSTPVCTADSAKTVNFEQVTPVMLRKGVAKKLDFAINCKSDYGSFIASASLTTKTPSADASTILVTDAGGNTDRLKIKIEDSSGKTIMVNGSNSEQLSSTVSQSDAEFHWTATLLPVGSTSPVAGNFSAKAEIVFDIQ